ncbi:MAG TPA: hypothetical protein VD973_15480 [Symbiobacteriaceae bacterium]|nr:hypothetical protein [Symbiobacteriaceae bacterium]
MVYVLMALLGIGGAIFTVMRSRARAELLSVYLVAWGLVCIAEWLAHSMFDLYRYRTGLSLNPHYDTAWGIFLGEFIFLPALNVILVGYFRPWLAVIIGTLLVTVMEIVFVPLGLFIQTGWRLWHTIVTFPLYFGAVGLYWHWAKKTGMKDGRLLAVARYGAIVGLVTTGSLYVYATQVTETDLRLLPTAEATGSMVRLFMHGIGMWLGFWALRPEAWSERWGRIAVTIAAMIVVTDAFTGFGLLYFLRPFSGVMDAGAIGVITVLAGLIMDWVRGLAKGAPAPRAAHWEPPDV